MKSLHVKQNKEFLILIILAIVFFFIYSYLSLSQLTQSEVPISEVGLRFNTPDEVMNYYFTQLYLENSKMYYEEPLNLIAAGVIFPRWAKPIGDRIVPGTFQGIILIYGSIAKIVGKWAIPFLTPLFAVIGVLFFYLLIKLIFNKQVAFISACLMFIFPGFWYYASRTMFHNVLFLTFLIMGFYFLLRLFHTDQHGYEYRSTRIRGIILSVLGGLFIGLALITRTSEIVWVGLLILITILFYRKKIIQNKKLLLYYFITLLLIILCFVPVLYQNKILYGSYFSTGYSAIVSENLEDLLQIKKISLFQAIFLPFGFHPRVIITHVLNKYFVQLFWPWIIWFLAGLIIFFKTKKNRQQKLFFGYLLLVTCYLLLYYGSWFFQDSLNPNLISIGSSYIRYFLPVYVLSLPFVALSLIGFYKILTAKSQILAKIFVIFIFCSLFSASFFQVYFKGPESLMAIKNNILNYRIQAQSILKKTKPDDIILTDVSNDKIIFPERQHIIVPQGGEELKKVLFLLKITDVYFFYRDINVSADYLNKIKFNQYDLEIYDGKAIDGGGILFKIKEKNDYYAFR